MPTDRFVKGLAKRLSTMPGVIGVRDRGLAQRLARALPTRDVLHMPKSESTVTVVQVQNPGGKL